MRDGEVMRGGIFGVNISFLPAAKPPDYEAYIDVVVDEHVPIPPSYWPPKSKLANDPSVRPQTGPIGYI